MYPQALTVDMTDAPSTVWNEVRITSDGISISLLSEGRGGRAIVEDEMWFTFDELQEMSPSEPMSLNLSDETQAALSENALDSVEFGEVETTPSTEGLSDNPSADELLDFMGLLGGEVSDGGESEVSSGNGLAASQSAYETPDVGDVLYDDPDRLPKWSEDDRVRVINVTEVPASEYELDTDDWGKETVADYNPGEPEDAPVVVANYIGSDNEYAFPVTRLSEDPQY